MKHFIQLMTIAWMIITIQTANAQTQPPNGGFENWVPAGTVEQPEGWASLNFMTDFGVPPLLLKTTDAWSGDFAIKVISDSIIIPPPIGNGLLDTVGGFTMLGVLSQSNLSGGIAYTDRPAEMSAYVKGTIGNGGSMLIMAQLSKFDVAADTSILVARATYLMEVIDTNYSQQVVPFDYFSSEIPDTLILRISAASATMSGTGAPGVGTATLGNALFVDDLSFIGITTDTKEAILEKVVVIAYPNPFEEYTTLRLEGLENKNYSFTLFNKQGQVVRFLENRIESQITISRDELSAGLYYYHIQTENQKIGRGKLVIF